MPNWRYILSQLAVAAEGRLDALKRRLDERSGDEPIGIVAYRSYGTPEQLFVKGRVLEEANIQPASETDSAWRNLANMYRRFESDEIAGARVLARYGEATHEARTDEEGFFEILLAPAAPLPPNRLWHAVDLALLEPLRAGQAEARASGAVLVPPASARFGVISDIDDTVLQSDATSLLRVMRATFLGNARTRLPFPGVAAFYRALLDGTHGNDLNPLFYVSSSPWNLYDLLVDFFGLQNIPLGPVLFLRDWGLTPEEMLPIHNRVYKMKVIRELMDFYHDLPFMLIGDSGQEDPEIYREVVNSFPGRVPAVYIRNVSRDLKRPEAINTLAQEVLQHGSTLILADDTLSIAKHAAEQGWIASQALHGIQFEKSKDEEPPSPVEQLLAGEPKAEGPTVSVEGQKAEAVEQGAIEEALKTGEEKKEKPPTVVVKSDEEPEQPPKKAPDG